jgi:hypothetical protein
MNRRIIQIAASEAASDNWYSRHALALCDDGTVWEICTSYLDRAKDGDIWRQLPPIPQTPIAAEGGDA